MSLRSAMMLLPAVLALGACDKRAATGGQANAAAAVTPDEVPSAPAEAAATGFDRSHRGSPVPAVALTGLDGRPARLADYRGKPLLVNVWATWCAPCVAEMPTLDRAAATVRVVAVSQDMDGAARVRPFLAAHGIARVEPLLDPKLEMGTGLAANLPVTLLYDAEGREVWRRAGGFRWDTPEAAKAIAEASG